MAIPALHQRHHPRPGARPREHGGPKLVLVKSSARPARVEGPTRALRSYALLSSTGFAAALVLALLAPTAERLQAFAAFGASASLVLLAVAPLARRTWQRLVNFAAAVTVAVLSLQALQSVTAGYSSLLMLAAASLLQLQFSREHDWHAPGPAWFLFITSIGLLWFV